MHYVWEYVFFYHPVNKNSYRKENQISNYSAYLVSMECDLVANTQSTVGYIIKKWMEEWKSSNLLTLSWPNNFE